MYFFILDTFSELLLWIGDLQLKYLALSTICCCALIYTWSENESETISDYHFEATLLVLR